MAFSNIDNQQLGKFLQIAFSDGVRSQISEDYRDWEMIKRVRVGDPDGRELRFLFQSSFGPAAIQYRNPNFSSTFPASQSISTSEHTAVYKEIDATVELEYNLWNRARKSPAKYAEPLAREIMSKTIAAKRRLAADLYGDGTGVVIQASSASDAAIASGEVTVTLNTADTARGHIGFAEYGDLLLAYSTAGVAVSPTGGSGFYAYRVKSKSRKNDQVVLQLVDSSGVVITTYTASNIVSTNVFYRVGQPTIPNLGSISDYGTATEVLAGLESLAAADGRVVHGITMSGATASSEVDCSANPLDVSFIQEMMDLAKINVGRGAYRWKQLVGAPEALAALIESRETDRRFISLDDATRGVRKFAYQHEQDSLEVVTSEYTPKKRMYALPEAKDSAKVLEYHGSDFEPVKANDSSEFNLKPSSSGGHERRIISYMEALCVLICKHPAAIGRLRNFTF